MDILLDYVNMKRPNYVTVESFYQHYGIVLTLAGQQRGYDEICLTRHNTDVPFSFRRLQEKYAGTEKAKMFLFRSDENEKKLESCLMKSQETYLEFVIGCMDGKLDVDILNEIISQTSSKNFMALATDDPFKVNFELSVQPLDIESYIEAFGIIYPIMRNGGKDFSRIKVCKNCNDFFFATSLKADFCSVKCRNAFNYRKNR